jgi:diguanylate cyclase (GGDEF)-like protein
VVNLPSPAELPDPEGHAPRIGLRQLPWLALLTGLGVLLNLWPVPLYYGIHLLMGSVPPILALLLWRTWWAVPMGLLAALQTWTLWGHPWAVLIFTLEMVWLTVAVRRFNGPPGREDNGRVVLFSMSYWLLLGFPLVLLAYGVVMGFDPVNVQISAVKQAFNGVFNTVLAFGALILVRGLMTARSHGPGVSLRGVIMALALLAITVPSLLISLAAGHQLEIAVQRGALDGLATVNLALSRATDRDQNTQLLMQQLGEGMAYRRIEPNGSVTSSDPALFHRLDAEFRDGGRNNVHVPELAILIPRAKGPSLRKWVKGYWSYSRQYRIAAGGGTALVQVVEPARTMVIRLQQQSAILLGVTFAVEVLGTLASLWLGRRFEQDFQQVMIPLAQDSNELQPLRLSAVSELRRLALLINHRIQQVNSLGARLRQANDNLRRSRTELKAMLRCDPLTGCGNPEALERRLREEVDRCGRSGEALSCLVLDVDHLAAINSEHGRRAGDALLQGLVLATRKRLRICDHLYRLRGDCFVVLAIGCPAAAALELGQQLQKAMAELYLIPEAATSPGIPHQLRASMCLGISCFEPGRDSADSLLQRATEALTTARSRGSGQLASAGI